ncbi:MAG TPA: formate/nitrite transporter family protein [Mycobacteriales bacterium]|jgi:formate/nitrite transporter FocA (FNT family)|nr:formate/nitrite transporter family protein [Mycobacteriales bacterium]
MAVGTRTRPGETEDEDDVVASNEQEVEDTLQRTVEEGKRRLDRSWAPLIATGLVGGIDVGTGVMALLVVESETGNKLLAGLAFSIGFIALAMARSELFTEDFLVPVGTVIARQAPLRQLGRLWAVTAAGNLVGGWIFTALIIAGFPSVRKTAADAGAYYTGLGIGWRSFALALLGGAVITLMTWMQHATQSLGVKLVPAVTTGFLLAALQLNHAIVASLIIFAGLHTHMTSYGYLDWAGAAAWAALGNMIGGIALVTLLRLLQVPHKVKEHADNPSPDVTAT